MQKNFRSKLPVICACFFAVKILGGYNLKLGNLKETLPKIAVNVIFLHVDSRLVALKNHLLSKIYVKCYL